MQTLNNDFDLEPTIYNVYARTDNKNKVIKIFSDCFEQPNDTDILIKSGSGDEYVHVQGKYNLFAENGVHRYKIENNILVECSEDEIAEEISSLPPPPETDRQKIARLEMENAALKAQQEEQDEMILENNYQLLLLQENLIDIV